jgi:hypothetical protein
VVILPRPEINITSLTNLPSVVNTSNAYFTGVTGAGKACIADVVDTSEAVIYVCSLLIFFDQQ